MEQKCTTHALSVRIWNVLFLLSVLFFSGCNVITSGDDISPEKANGTNMGGLSTAGLIIGIAGNKGALYAVSPDAGIWRNGVDVNGKWGSWKQLQASPRYSNCIAVDPLNNFHIVVGQRIGDAIKNSDNKCGVWESYDGGTTFPDTYYFDPSAGKAQVPDASKIQLVESIVFTAQRTTLVATAYGIARKIISSNTYDFSHTPATTLITALSTFDECIVARDKSNIYISENDGLTWTTTPIPSSVDGLTVTWNARGDEYSVAVIKNPADNKCFVYLSFKPTEDIGSKNTILIFDVANNVWHAQTMTTGDGTGAGGRRFIKSFAISSQRSDVGYGAQLMYCGAQEIMQATSIDDNGIPAWTEFMQGSAAGPYPRPNDPVHSDLWDFHFEPTGAYSFVACDGGVFQNAPFSASPAWSSLNSGLHTHHIHSIATVSLDNLHVIGYATSDNDTWVNQQADNWMATGYEGDANWVTNDAGTGTVLISGRHFKNGALIPFPSLASKAITINNDLTFFINQIKCIQTRPSEPQQTSLDVVMLANLPFPGVLGQPNANGNPVLLRNKTFNANPDINLSMGTGWVLAADNLPAGTIAFWLSGGHSPVYFVYAVVNDIPGIYKGGIVVKKYPSGTSWVWTRLNIDNVDPPAEYGPLFVNPYDSKVLYVATSGGIYISGDGGNSFAEDVILTKLVTGSGKYPMYGTFSGGNGTSLPGTSATHANAMCPLSCMAFGRNDPGKIVASSPYTGIFYKNENADWKDLTKYLPTPFTPISAVTMSGSDIYIGTEGRGLLRINNY